jgi:hypothetical protein
MTKAEPSDRQGLWRQIAAGQWMSYAPRGQAFFGAQYTDGDGVRADHASHSAGELKIAHEAGVSA